MKPDMSQRRWRGVAAALAMSTAIGLLFVGSTEASAAVAPTLTITPGPYHDGQLINVSVGANRYFTPYSRINIIECADAGGKKKNLPVSATTCDGNTIQGTTILVQRNGSWSERGYQLYALPDRTQLGETPDSEPVCNQKKACVLYIGQNQEKFTAPKLFSPAFTISKAGRHG
jgi:hypothetical protein